MLKRLCIVCMCALVFGCRPGPETEPQPEPVVDASTPDKTPVVDTPPPPERRAEAAPPERRVVPEPQPEPPPVDKGPVVPEKVLINGIQVTIVHVTDGDTIYVVKKPGGWANVVRIKGLNSPECHKQRASGGSFQECDSDDEVYGLESYKIAKAIALGDFRKAKIVCIMKNNECEKGDFDRYLAYLELPDGRDLAQEIIRGGAGWAFTAFTAKKLKLFCEAEADAIKAKVGMWSKGRPAVKPGMSNNTRSWYYHKTQSKSHDGICSGLMGSSFAKRAGE